MNGIKKITLSCACYLLCIGFLIQTGSLHAGWSKTYTVREGEYEYWYPEELIDYLIPFPAHTVEPGALTVTVNGEEKPYQLSEVKYSGGYLDKARVHFRTALDTGQVLNIRFEHDPTYKADFNDQVTIRDNRDGTAVIRANKQQLKVPFGDRLYPSPVNAASAPAPILAMGRDGNLIGKGSFMAGPDVTVSQVKGMVVEDGPLFIRYRLEYTFNDNRSYQVELTVQHNEQHVLFDEYLHGFSRAHDVAFRFSYRDGVNPNGRLFLTNKGYAEDEHIGRAGRSGKYDRNVDEEGRLPINIGMYQSGYFHVNRATVFWNDQGKYGIMFVANRLKDWKSEIWQVWNALDSGLEIRFYAHNNDAYALYGLNGEERHSALGVIPRDEVMLRSFYGDKSWLAVSDLEGLTDERGRQKLEYGAGPEQRLNQKLNDFSLNFVKDIVYEWDIDMSHTWDPATVEVRQETFNFYRYQGHRGEFWRQWVPFLVDFGWDVSGPLGGTCFRHGTKAFTRYLASRNSWSPKAHERMKNFMIHFTEMIDDYDNAHPYRCMMSGQPNFAIDVFNMLPVAAATFPNHPAAPGWAGKYVDYAFPEFLRVYVRNPAPANNALDGLFTENIACYNTTSLIAAVHAEEALKEFNGSRTFTEPAFRSWMRYLIYAMVPTGAGKQRYLPPQGAHAWPPDRAEEDMKEAASLLTEVDPEGGKALQYTMGMPGGENPKLESALFNDFGVIFRYKYGTPEEVYLWVQNLYGDFPTTPSSRLYRTGRHYKSSGVTYYAARENIYSWNGKEVNGDDWNKDSLTMFVAGDGSLASSPTNNILYNFGFAQFYRTEGSAVRNNYKSRDVMLVRGDYVAFFDDLTSGTFDGRFQWKNTLGEMPNIEGVRTGPGDELHLVSPHTVSLEARDKTYGVLVDGKEYVLINDRSGSFSEDDMRFEGRTGYARERELALFEGTLLSLGDFSIERSGGDFGFSARMVDNNRIEGRVAGRRGGKVKITVPGGFRMKDMELQVLRERGVSKITPVVEGNSFAFDVIISQEDGYYINYAIVPAGTEPGELPCHPKPLKTPQPRMKY